MIIRFGGSWIKTDLDKVFLYCLQSMIISPVNLTPTEHVNDIHDYLSSPIVLSIPFTSLSLKQVEIMITTLSASKASDYDHSHFKANSNKKIRIYLTNT